MLIITATSQRRGSRTRLERICWKWACARAQARRVELEDAVGGSALATLPADDTLNYPEREDVLYQASQKALGIKMVLPVAMRMSHVVMR